MKHFGIRMDKSMSARTHLKEGSTYPVPLILKRNENMRKVAPFARSEVTEEPRNYYLVDVNMWELLHHNYLKTLPAAPASVAAAPGSSAVKPLPRSLKLGHNGSNNFSASGRYLQPRLPAEPTFRPSPSTDFNFRPSVDFNHRPRLLTHFNYRTNSSTDFNYRPSLSTGLSYRPHLSTDFRYRPTLPTVSAELNVQSNFPTELNLRPSMPVELDFRPTLPVELDFGQTLPAEYRPALAAEYRPALPAEYRPALPAEYRSALPTELDFPTLPTDLNFQPTLQTELDFRPSLPTELNFRPTSQHDLNFRPITPQELNFGPVVSTDLNYRTSVPPESGSRTKHKSRSNSEEKSVADTSTSSKSNSAPGLSPALPLLSEKRPATTTAPRSRKSPNSRKKRLFDHQSPVSRKRCTSGCKMTHRIQPVCLNKVFQNESKNEAKKLKDVSKNSKPVEQKRRSAPRRTGAKKNIFKESDYIREYRSEEELRSKYRGIQYYLFDEAEVREAIAETRKLLMDTLKT